MFSIVNIYNIMFIVDLNSLFITRHQLHRINSSALTTEYIHIYIYT